MKTKLHFLSRVLAPVGLVALAACQTVPQKPVDDAATTAPATTAPGGSTAPVEGGGAAPAVQSDNQAAPVGVFLADTKRHDNWASVNVQPEGTLYVQPQAVITREDLTGVQAGTNDRNEGLLALDLNPEAAARLRQLTTQNPNMRLALVVGDTMLAAPTYSAPVSQGRLIFMVGTEANAMAAARAIAGPDAQPSSQGQGAGQSAPGAQPPASTQPRSQTGGK